MNVLIGTGRASLVSQVQEAQIWETVLVLLVAGLAVFAHCGLQSTVSQFPIFLLPPGLHSWPFSPPPFPPFLGPALGTFAQKEEESSWTTNLGRPKICAHHDIESRDLVPNLKMRAGLADH